MPPMTGMQSVVFAGSSRFVLSEGDRTRIAMNGAPKFGKLRSRFGITHLGANFEEGGGKAAKDRRRD